MSGLVFEALLMIHESVNVSTGLTHPNDIASAKEMFLRLHNAGEKLDGVAIAAWAEDHGWKSKYAKQLGDVASVISAGTKPRIDAPSWREDILKVLAAKIKDSTNPNCS